MEETFKFYNPKKENKNESQNLSSNYSFNRKRRIEIPTKITIFNPLNLKYIQSDQISSLKEINKNYPINQNIILSNTERNNLEKKIKRPNVNNTLNDIYNAINNINRLDGKIKNIISHSSKKIKSEQTSNNNFFEKNVNINDPIIKSNSQIIRIPERNKIIYRNHEKNKRGYYTDYNNAFSEENKYKTSSLFRKPKYQTSTNRTNYTKFFQYKKYFFLNDSEKENENDNNLSDYNSISSNLSKEQDNDNKNHKNNTYYGGKFKDKEDCYSEKIMNMKFNLRNIRDKKINNINKEQKELNSLIDQMQIKNNFFQNRTDINIFKRNHNIKGFLSLKKYKKSESKKLNDIINIDNDNKYKINLNYNNDFKSITNNYNKKYESDNDEIDSEYINYIYKNDKALIKNNYCYNKLRLNKNVNRKQSDQKIWNTNTNSYNFNDYVKNKIEENNKEYNDSNICLNNAKELIREIYEYKNSKNTFRNKNKYYSFNTDLNNNNKEKIMENIRNKKYKKHNKIKAKIPYNNYRLNIERKYNKLFHNNGSSCSSNYNFENKFISRNIFNN